MKTDNSHPKLIVVLAILAIFAAACGSATPDPQAIAAAVAGTIAAMPAPAPVQVEVEVTRVVEVTRIVEVTTDVIVTPTPLPAPPTPTPSNHQDIIVGEPIVLESFSSYNDSRNLSVLAMVENPNPDWWMPVSNATLSVFDQRDRIIGTEDDVIYLGPSETAPLLYWSVDIGGDPSTQYRIVIELKPDPLRPLSAWPGAKAELVQSNRVNDHVIGQVQNTGEVDIPQTKILAIVRNSAGEVIDFDFTFADDMEPGQIVPFDLSIFGLEDDDTYELFLQPELIAGTF